MGKLEKDVSAECRLFTDLKIGSTHLVSNLFRVFSPAYFDDSATGTIREAETWKDLYKVEWCQVYRTTGQPCSCPMCSGERYSRVDFKRETAKAIREQLESE